MSSGFPGNEYYGNAGIGVGSAMNNSIRAQYRRNFAGILVDPSQSQAIHQNPVLVKRPLTEFERQQQQNLLLLRSVKQRTHLSSPISPLSPIDLCNASSTDISTSSLVLPQHHRNLIGLNGRNFTNSPVPNRFPVVVGGENPESEKKKKMRNQLQELERQLLGDDDEDDEDGENGSVISAAASSEWSETMQNLIAPKPHPTSPTSSCSSCTTTSSSPAPSPPSPTPSLSPSASSSKQLLMDSAAAIADGKIETASGILARLKQTSNPRATDPEQRLTAHFVSALLSRINPADSGSGFSIADLCSSEHAISTQFLYEASPCFKLAFMAANLAIFEATRDHRKIHIVDFDIGHGYQYATLFNALADRQPINRPFVKITAVTDPNLIGSGGASANNITLQAVGDWLTSRAKQAGIALRFSVASLRASDLSRELIGCEPDEALAVNFAFRLYRMPDESVSTANPRDELLRCVKRLNPSVVTLIEQDMNTNTAPFLARFGEAWAYYRAMFESLEATLPRDGPEKIRIEECLARKAANAVAREGRDRLERCEPFGKWRARMGMAGFQPRLLSSNISDPMRPRAARAHPSFFVKDDNNGICFGWMARTLTVVSAWR